MANLTLPNANVPIGKNGTEINDVWYQKFVAWLSRSNKVSPENLTVTATSDTNLRFSYVGSDGVTRVADVTLA